VPWSKFDGIDTETMLIFSTSSVRYIPTWFPGAGFQRTAEQGRKLSYDLRNLPFEEAKERLVSTPFRTNNTLLNWPY